MPRPRFKQKCAICKKNMVEMFSSRQFPICVECHMRRISDPVTVPPYRDLLTISDELYQKSSFLRNIKEAFLRYGSLTENQVSAFKKVVEEVKHAKPEPILPPEPIVITEDIWSRPKRTRKKKEIKSSV